MPETKQYGIIYADPPWHYDRKHGSGVAENHYPTMSIEEICALPVSELAAKDSALFLWATFPQLNEAFRVIDAWGFKYKTLAFLWLKQNRKADSWFYQCQLETQTGGFQPEVPSAVPLGTQYAGR